MEYVAGFILGVIAWQYACVWLERFNKDFLCFGIFAGIMVVTQSLARFCRDFRKRNVHTLFICPDGKPRHCPTGYCNVLAFEGYDLPDKTDELDTLYGNDLWGNKTPIRKEYYWDCMTASLKFQECPKSVWGNYEEIDKKFLKKCLKDYLKD